MSIYNLLEDEDKVPKGWIGPLKEGSCHDLSPQLGEHLMAKIRSLTRNGDDSAEAEDRVVQFFERIAALLTCFYDSNSIAGVLSATHLFITKYTTKSVMGIVSRYAQELIMGHHSQLVP